MDSDPAKSIVSTRRPGASFPPRVGGDVEPFILEDLRKVDEPDATHSAWPRAALARSSGLQTPHHPALGRDRAHASRSSAATDGLHAPSEGSTLATDGLHATRCPALHRCPLAATWVECHYFLPFFTDALAWRMALPGEAPRFFADA